MGHWGWLIGIYLFLGGLAAGSFLTSFAAEKGWLGKSDRLARWGYIVSGPLAGIGCLLLVFDLGQGQHKPWLILGMFKNFTSSVMTWGVIILSVFIIVGLIRGFLAFLRKPAPQFLNWIGAVFALGTMAYTGILLAVLENIPLWNTPWLPVLFVVSACSTGVSFVVLLSHFLDKGHTDERILSILHGVLVVLELIVVAIFILVQRQDAVASQSIDMWLSGDYKLAFWGVFLAAGLVLPLISYIWGMFKYKSPATAGAQEAAAAGHEASIVTLISDFLVLCGGLALRCIVVFAALPLWDGILR